MRGGEISDASTINFVDPAEVANAALFEHMYFSSPSGNARQNKWPLLDFWS